MKTLSEFNTEIITKLKQYRSKVHLSGVACDTCCSELEFTEPGTLLMSNPPRKRVKCPNCNTYDYMTVFDKC